MVSAPVARWLAAAPPSLDPTSYFFKSGNATCGSVRRLRFLRYVVFVWKCFRNFFFFFDTEPASAVLSFASVFKVLIRVSADSQETPHS